MNAKYLAVGVGSAAIGFMAGFLVKHFIDKKKIKGIVESTQRSVDELIKELNECKPVKRNYISEPAVKESSFPWDKVNDKTGELDDTVIEIQEGEPTMKSELSFRAPEEERENYHAIRSGNMYVDEPYQEDHLIRYPDTVDDGTYEISEQEAEAVKRSYPIEDVAYYEASGKLFYDGEEVYMDDVSPMLGYTMHELSQRFLRGDTTEIFLQNECRHKIYRVTSLPGLMPE